MLRHTVPSQAAGGGGRRGGGGEDVLFLHVLLSPPSVRASERGSEGCDRRKDEAWAQDRQDRGALSLARSLALFLSFSLALPPSLPPSLGHELLSNSNMWSQCALARSLARPFSSASTIWQSQRTPRDTTRCGWESGSENRLNR